LKKALKEQLDNKMNEEVFLAATLHKENLSSKNVSNFFELNDYLFVNRRSGRDRQVHILRLAREEIPEYIKRMENKIEIIYGYNKNDISNKEDEPEL